MRRDSQHWAWLYLLTTTPPNAEEDVQVCAISCVLKTVMYSVLRSFRRVCASSFCHTRRHFITCQYSRRMAICTSSALGYHSPLLRDGLSTSLVGRVTDLPVRYHSVGNSEHQIGETVNISYVDRDGERHTIKGKAGDNVMYLGQKHDLDVEGACEASLACCTCHVYVKEEFYDMLGEPSEEEEDMLDLAPFLQENSRLSCQIILSKEIDGIEVTLPSATRNFYVDGHKPKHH